MEGICSGQIQRYRAITVQCVACLMESHLGCSWTPTTTTLANLVDLLAPIVRLAFPARGSQTLICDPLMLVDMVVALRWFAAVDDVHRYEATRPIGSSGL